MYAAGTAEAKRLFGAELIGKMLEMLSYAALCGDVGVDGDGDELTPMCAARFFMVRTTWGFVDFKHSMLLAA